MEKSYFKTQQGTEFYQVLEATCNIQQTLCVHESHSYDEIPVNSLFCEIQEV